MAKRQKCPKCGRYRAKKKGIFRRKLKCDYCKATSTTKIKKVKVKTGWFSRQTLYVKKHNIKGGSKWSKNWREQRKRALKKAKYKCKKCGSEYGLQVHHKKPVSKGGKDKLSNLEVLCGTCHKKAHRKR